MANLFRLGEEAGDIAAKTGVVEALAKSGVGEAAARFADEALTLGRRAAGRVLGGAHNNIEEIVDGTSVLRQPLWTPIDGDGFQIRPSTNYDNLPAASIGSKVRTAATGDDLVTAVPKSKGRTTVFEMPGDGGPQPYNDTMESLWAAMSGSTARAAKTGDDLVKAIPKAERGSGFELPGDGGPQPYNDTMESLWAAMDGSTARAGRAAKLPETSVSASQRAERGSTGFEMPGEGFSSRRNETYDDLYAAMGPKANRVRATETPREPKPRLGKDGSRVTVSRLAPRHTTFEMPGDGFGGGPESILP